MGYQGARMSLSPVSVLAVRTRVVSNPCGSVYPVPTLMRLDQVGAPLDAPKTWYS